MPETIHQRINARAIREQDTALNFPTLYGNRKRLTREYLGIHKNFERNLKLGKYEV